MYNIKLLNKISNVGLAKFDTKEFAYADDMENPDAIMVRSASMHDMQIFIRLLSSGTTVPWNIFELSRKL